LFRSGIESKFAIKTATVGRWYMIPVNIFIKDYSYSLPEDKIARYPLAERDASKLLVYQNGLITEDVYKNISDHLPPGSLLVFNNTKVIEARILFQKPTGGVIEIFCLEPSSQYHDITTAMTNKGKVLWYCMIGGASKWKHGQVLEKNINEIRLQARYISKNADSFGIEFSWTPADLSFAEILHSAGTIPLPPYLKREAEQADKERYQTLYAGPEGSVAAPTAGLHFTSTIFNKLKEKNIKSQFLTLHVGTGTFKPVKTATIAEHEMHAEVFTVSIDTIQSLIDNLDGNIIPVGTTSLRTLESLYWIGVKILNQSPDLKIRQWETYDLNDKNISSITALEALKDHMINNGMKKLISTTQLLIAPGYKFKLATALITNFHQPQSTLLLLVAAFIGKDWKQVYNYALNNDFRFLSYGDGCLFWK
jgi:S-adenosylmethionine:tRNA ribosyltransferase-isomerase